MIALLCLVLGLAVGFVIGHAIGSAPTDPPWADLDASEGGASATSPARTSLRVVGGGERRPATSPRSSTAHSPGMGKRCEAPRRPVRRITQETPVNDPTPEQKAAWDAYTAARYERDARRKREAS